MKVKIFNASTHMRESLDGLEYVVNTFLAANKDIKIIKVLQSESKGYDSTFRLLRENITITIFYEEVENDS